MYGADGFPIGGFFRLLVLVLFDPQLIIFACSWIKWLERQQSFAVYRSEKTTTVFRSTNSRLTSFNATVDSSVGAWKDQLHDTQFHYWWSRAIVYCSGICFIRYCIDMVLRLMREGFYSLVQWPRLAKFGKKAVFTRYHMYRYLWASRWGATPLMKDWDRIDGCTSLETILHCYACTTVMNAHAHANHW